MISFLCFLPHALKLSHHVR